MSFYGPSVLAGFAENCGMFPYLAESFRRAVFVAEPMGVVAPNTDGWTVEVLDRETGAREGGHMETMLDQPLPHME